MTCLFSLVPLSLNPHLKLHPGVRFYVVFTLCQYLKLCCVLVDLALTGLYWLGRMLWAQAGSPHSAEQGASLCRFRASLSHACSFTGVTAFQLSNHEAASTLQLRSLIVTLVQKTYNPLTLGPSEEPDCLISFLSHMAVLQNQSGKVVILQELSHKYIFSHPL